MSTFTLKVDPGGGVSLPREVLDQFGLEAGDELRLAVLDQSMELTAQTGGNGYARWRVISHELIEEQAADAA